MKSAPFWLTIALLTAQSCSDVPENSENSGAARSISPTSAPPAVTCYSSTLDDGTTIQVRLEESAERVIGELAYLYPEQHSGSGTFEGVREGDHYRVVWTYTIEGHEQKEEIVFTTDGNSWTRKNGEIVEKNGVMVLKDEANAPYDESIPRIDCQ